MAIKIKLLVFVILIIVLSLCPHSKANKNDFIVLLAKFKKQSQSYSRVTIVAGVRGDDVQKQDKQQLRKDLYWED